VNPWTVKYKAALLAAALVGAAGAGWVTNGWRMGKRIEAQRADYFQARARRGDDYQDALVKAAETANTRTREAQALLSRARLAKAKSLASASQTAPKGPTFECLNTPLPDPYLETFRQ